MSEKSEMNKRSVEVVDAKSEVRERLLQAADTCFQRNGILKTSMDEVAATASLSLSTLYRSFDGRDDLILAVLVRRTRLFAERCERLFEHQSSFSDVLVEGMSLALTTGSRDPFVSLLVGPDSVGTLSRIVGSSEKLYEVTSGLWRPVLERGIASGEVRKDLDVGRACRWLVEVQFILLTRLSRGDITLADARVTIHDLVLPGLTRRRERS